MKRRNTGITLVETVIAVAICLFAMTAVWQGVRFLQSMLAQQMRLGRVNQVLQLTQELTKAIRGAHRIRSVGPDHLDLEVYDHAHFGLLDPRLFENLKRVRYQYNAQGKSGAMVREVYASTAAATAEQSQVFLKDVDLATPTDAQPFFQASYLVGASTVGVRVEFVLHKPYAKEAWVPIKDEAYVQAH